MNGRSVLASALLAVMLIAVGWWALNNTSLGLNIKCRVFNDFGACVVLALTESASPAGGTTNVAAPTETPEKRAQREAAEQQARLDSSVTDASRALGNAADDVTNNAGDLSNDAADLTAAVADVRSSLADMQLSYNDLKVETQVRPMDDVEQSQVCVALNQVEVSRGQVDVSIGQFSTPLDTYKSALADRSGYVANVEAAIASLNAAVAADPGGVRPPYTAANAGSGLSSAADAAK